MLNPIKTLRAREILDSRGNPTVEVDCLLSDGSFGRASVPSGASTGKHEAVELRDSNPKRYGGLGVQTATAHVQELARALRRVDAYDQEAVDEAMIACDGTDNKSRLGANAILAVSMAVLKAHAASLGLPLYKTIAQMYRPHTKQWMMPLPMMNIINGGAHADFGADFQEFMILPIGAKTMANAVRMGSEVFHTLKGVLKKKGLSTGVGDEGGFAPRVAHNSDAPAMITKAIKLAGYRPGKDIALGLDAAASEFYKSADRHSGLACPPVALAPGHGRRDPESSRRSNLRQRRIRLGRKVQDDGVCCYYDLKRDQKKLSSTQMIAYYQQWVGKFPFVSIEDPLSEDDWQSWPGFTQTLGKKVQVVGDDIFVTNTKLLKKGIAMNAANAILIKVNQIGTITETVRAVDMARAAGWHAVVSHRSGETEDTTIADLVVGLGTGQIKTGSLSRTERTAKYNQLMRIEEELGKSAHYPGAGALRF